MPCSIRLEMTSPGLSTWETWNASMKCQVKHPNISMHTVDHLYSPDGVHTVGRQHFPHSSLAIQGPSSQEAARTKHKNQSVLVQELHVQAQPPLPPGLKLPGSTLLYCPPHSISKIPPTCFFNFSFLAGPQGT